MSFYFVIELLELMKNDGIVKFYLQFFFNRMKNEQKNILNINF